MATRAIVLGAGMVGSVMAGDLAADTDFDVSIADRRREALDRATARAAGVTPVEADLGDPDRVKRLVADYDIVLGALSSTIGFQTLRAVIEAGKNYCDISFMPENALELDHLAREAGVTAVVDCGVAPGMSNLLVGHAQSRLDQVDDVRIYVGGVPEKRERPLEYKAGFSPADVLEEYTRPSRLVENGEVVVREALSGVEHVEFPKVGRLEAFNTDGLRTLIDTVYAPCMREKTLRYPGHAEMMRVLRHIGLLSHDEVEVGAGADKARVRPIDVLSALLFPKWTYEPGEADLTIMRVSVRGRRGAERAGFRWDLIDRFDDETQTTSMARTTAFPCAIVARLIADGSFARRGVCPPEFIGREPNLTERILKNLRARGLEFMETIEFPEGP